MTDFSFDPLVRSPHADIISTALGVNAAGKFADNDIGKPVKLAANDNHVLCDNGDPIDGFVFSISAETYNDGFSFGSIVKDGRVKVQVDTASISTLVVGTFVEAGTSAALGTAETYPQVDLHTPVVGEPVWQVISIISGTGVADDLILIERLK